jgi:hypothetical protein
MPIIGYPCIIECAGGGAVCHYARSGSSCRAQRASQGRYPRARRCSAAGGAGAAAGGAGAAADEDTDSAHSGRALLLCAMNLRTRSRSTPSQQRKGGPGAGAAADEDADLKALLPCGAAASTVRWPTPPPPRLLRVRRGHVTHVDRPALSRR